MANNFYAAIGLVGGGIGALDNIDGTALADGDAAIVQTDGTVYFYHLDATSAAAESSPNIIKPDTNAGDKRWIKQSVSGASTPDYIRLHDLKADGVDGGDFTAGAWRTRDVVEEQDLGGHCSVAANVITLAAGTYDCFIRCPCFFVNQHQSRLYNTSDSSLVVLGSSGYAASAHSVANDSFIRGRFVLAASKNLEIQHRCDDTQNGNGLGVGNVWAGDEIYTVAEFWKVA